MHLDPCYLMVCRRWNLDRLMASVMSLGIYRKGVTWGSPPTIISLVIFVGMSTSFYHTTQYLLSGTQQYIHIHARFFSYLLSLAAKLEGTCHTLGLHLVSSGIGIQKGTDAWGENFMRCCLAWEAEALQTERLKPALSMCPEKCQVEAGVLAGFTDTAMRKEAEGQFTRILIRL